MMEKKPKRCPGGGHAMESDEEEAQFSTYIWQRRAVSVTGTAAFKTSFHTTQLSLSPLGPGYIMRNGAFLCSLP